MKASRRGQASIRSVRECHRVPRIDPAVRDGIKRYSNWPTIPQVFIDGKFVGGCDIVHELHERGELAPMLKNAFEK